MREARLLQPRKLILAGSRRSSSSSSRHLLPTTVEATHFGNAAKSPIPHAHDRAHSSKEPLQTHATIPLCLHPHSAAISFTDAEAFSAARELLRREGILAGSSSGGLLAAALRYCRAQTAPKRVVTLVCDSGARYLSKQFNDAWMRDNGFVDRGVPSGDVRDLIARRHQFGEDIWAHPALPVEQAIRRMRAHGISQMAVVVQEEDGAVGGNVSFQAVPEGPESSCQAASRGSGKLKRSKVVGIIDESDLLLALLRDGKEATKHPVSKYMEPRVETVAPTAVPADLLPILRAGRVVVVAGEGGEPFYGLVTNIDLIQYLRAKVE